MLVSLPKLYRVLRTIDTCGEVAISAQSSTDLRVAPGECVDYIFVDPPFGGNLMYSELNLLWEAWLRVLTNGRAEAVVSRVQRKGLLEYQYLMEQCFCEFYRILKPGGRFINLETSQPSYLPIRRLFHFYVRLCVKPVGGRISGSYKAYTYLAHTIPRFYPPEELSDIMCRAGFKDVTYSKLLFGVAAIHQGRKP